MQIETERALEALAAATDLVSQRQSVVDNLEP
jgi:hypothetical protein